MNWDVGFEKWSKIQDFQKCEKCKNKKQKGKKAKWILALLGICKCFGLGLSWWKVNVQYDPFDSQTRQLLFFPFCVCSFMAEPNIELQKKKKETDEGKIDFCLPPFISFNFQLLNCKEKEGQITKPRVGSCVITNQT